MSTKTESKVETKENKESETTELVPTVELTAAELKLEQLTKKYPLAMGLQSIKPKKKKNQTRSIQIFFINHAN